MDSAEKTKVLNLLKTSRGQIEGIIKMVEDDRYCVDISKQILAVQAQLKKANLQILEQHIKHCVKEAVLSGSEEEKINEIIELLDRYVK
ncbi:MAG: metal-sensing transcriptional repressor [Bacillota bacterium]|nr:metal-sensing transcriptional repressor [Bacillota bacterium]NLU54892.1 metal-sensing transcriptional repressor [Bacillota bacterium]HOA90752.1 metal-sensing transcriptional repressor [Bacillota bacterium]HOJ46554.1 metal-sensing transcriptional repressor [Bacillota bacterium]HOL13847.1 metal-sensing transcriptional repressor [Bacillota bacterium]